MGAVTRLLYPAAVIAAVLGLLAGWGWGLGLW